MANLRFLALALVLAGAALLVVAAARGELRVGLFLVVPYFLGSGLFSLGGMVLLFAGATLWFLSRAQPIEPPPPTSRTFAESETPPPPRRRHGGVALIGPIPIVWGSDRGITRTMMLAGAALLVLAIVLALLL